MIALIAYKTKEEHCILRGGRILRYDIYLRKIRHLLAEMDIEGSDVTGVSNLYAKTISTNKCR